MTRLARSRTIAAGALALLGSAGFLAPPAEAAAPSVTVTGPGAGQEVSVSSFPVSAAVSMSDGRLVNEIRLSLVPLDAGSDQEPVNLATGANGTSSQNVSFGVTIDYNGKYRAVVSATGEDNGAPLIGDTNGLETRNSLNREFFVAAPPAVPANVRAVIDKETRVVTLSWSANSEKDLLFYVIQRAKGDGGFSVLGNSDGPGDTSIIDRSTADGAGEYRYQVVAVRRGATADKGENSDPSPVATADVPGAPGAPATAPDDSPAPTTPGGGAASTGAGGTGTGGSGAGPAPVAAGSPGALKKSGTIDLSGFSAIQSQARRNAPRSEAPDPGFNEALPFNSTNTTRLVGEDDSGAEPESGRGGDTEVRELGAQDASNDRQRSTAFLAVGLLATVLLMHLLWIKGEVQREPLEALVPE